MRDVTLSGLTLTRELVPNIVAQNTVQPVGLRCNYILNANIETVTCSEHAIGFYYGGVVASRFSECRAIRSSLSSGPVDFWWGHYLDGNITGVAAGGNASMYMFTCASEYNLLTFAAGDVIGLVADGAFVDTFIRDFEVANHKKGVAVVGTGPTGAQTSNIDFIIDHPVLDGCSDRGIEITRVAPGGVVEIVEPYVALAGPSALACYHIHDGAGSVRISGGQAICFLNSAAGGNALGVFADAQSGLVVERTAILGSKRPIALINSSDALLTPEIDNQSVVAVVGAVYIQNSTRVTVEPKVVGASGTFPVGIELFGADNTRVYVNWTRVDDAALISGSANRLLVNGLSVTSLGGFAGGFVIGA